MHTVMFHFAGCCRDQHRIARVEQISSKNGTVIVQVGEVLLELDMEGSTEHAAEPSESEGSAPEASAEALKDAAQDCGRQASGTPKTYTCMNHSTHLHDTFAGLKLL